LSFSGCRFVPQAYYDAIAEHRKPKRGDILYTVVGATYGRAVPVDTDRPFCVQRHIAILKPSQQVNHQFLHRALNSSTVYEQASKGLTGTAQPTLPLRALRSIRIPVPPLPEQIRLVRVIDELFERCEKTSQALNQRELTSATLLNSVLARSLQAQANSVQTESAPEYA
jgi:type I restriction enzyme S subunit